MRDQGINFAFINNPEEGDKTKISALINSIPLVFNNGLNTIDFEFTSNDSEILADPLHKVKIGSTIEDSVDNLKLFFESNGYSSSSIQITFEKKQLTYWYLVFHFYTESTILFVDEIINENIAPSFFDDNLENTVNLKYFFEYINIVNDKYRCDIMQKSFIGMPREIKGRATLLKNDVKDHLDAIRGSGMTLKLEADENLTFEDLYAYNESEFITKLYRNEKLIYSGFLKPDGINQSYTRSIWNINIDCVDGLGFLNDLSFTKTNGLQFTGKMSILDIIYNCLNKTGNQLNINTFVNIKYEGMSSTIDNSVLSKSFINVGRFIKSDDNTIMSCGEVLTSVLNVFSACITQQDGNWFIYRPNDIYFTNNPVWKKYNASNDFLYDFTYLPKSNIGSQIDNIYPYHCNGNQTIDIKGAVSAFRLGYKYGFIGSILGNGELNHVAGTSIYESWNVNNWDQSQETGFLYIDPVLDSGISFISGVILDTVERRTALTSTDVFTVYEGYSFEFKTRFISYGYPVTIRFNVYVDTGTTIYSLNYLDGSWHESPIYIYGFDVIGTENGKYPNSTGELVNQKFEKSYSIKTQPLPEGVVGDVKIIMNVPIKVFGSEAVRVDVKSIELINTFQGNNVIGEFHTVSRALPVSSIVKESKSVSIGDNISDVYKGAIYKENKAELTTFWSRNNFVESKPILRIASEDNLRINQRPLKLFSGSVFGFTEYLSAYTINKISGKFMPTGWDYDTYTNISNLKLLELYSGELGDIDYLRTDDYGETVKPTITS